MNPGEPGKYDDVCEKARTLCRAEGILLIVKGGFAGDGFSAQLPAHLVECIPTVLRQVADQIEEQYNKAKAN